MSHASYRLRPASPADIPATRDMQARSMRGLGRGYYAAETIAEFLDRIGTMDDAVVREGHFLVAVDPAGTILGSGGWSRLTPGYAAGHPPAPADEATIRSVFVAPDFGRRGIGTAIMACAEADAAAHGVRRLRLTATLSGVPLYASLGYRPTASKVIVLASGERFDCVDMQKLLDPERQAA